MKAPAIVVQNLTFSYGPCPILNKLNLELPSGEVTALIGPNGSGKSTLLKILSGLMPLSRRGGVSEHSRIALQGEDLRTQSSEQRARLVAYLSSEFRSEFSLTVYESVALGRICHNPSVAWKPTRLDQEKIESALERCDAMRLRNRLLPTLSGGEQQIVAVARALAQDTPVILLDETLSKMDLHHVAQIGELLVHLARDEGKTIVLVAHDMNLAAQWADFAVILKHGKILAQGPLKNTLTSENLAQLYPNTRLQVETSPTDGRPRVWLQNPLRAPLDAHK